MNINENIKNMGKTEEVYEEILHENIDKSTTPPNITQIALSDYFKDVEIIKIEDLKLANVFFNQKKILS